MTQQSKGEAKMNDRHHVSIVGPTLLVGLGVILLLNNLGYLTWSLWEIVRLWPILLIAAGLEVLLGHRSMWASVIAALLVLAMVAGGAWYLSRSATTGLGGQSRDLAYPRGNAEAASVVLEPSVGSLSVNALGDSPNFMEAIIRLLPGEELTEQYDEGARARVTLARAAGASTPVGLGQRATWDLTISPEVRLDLTADLGVGEAEIDLADLQVEQARLDFGVGQMRVTLPRETSAEVEVDGGIGTVTIYVPRGLGVRITADAGLVTRAVPSDYTRSGETYTSSAYDRSDYHVDVTVSLGIGSITVREVDPGK